VTAKFYFDAVPELLAGKTVDQVGIIVNDLRREVGIWSAVLGRDDWLFYTYQPATVPVLTYRGQPGTFSMRIALINAAPQIELIQPLNGPSIYHEWLGEHGTGLHHLGFRVPSVADAIGAMAVQGIPEIQTGSGYGQNGVGGFAYFDTQKALGFIYEAIEVPTVRRPTEEL
jgi:hypothetical protein